MVYFHKFLASFSVNYLWIFTICYFMLVQFDVTFPNIPCTLLSVDAMDISGERHMDIVCNPFFGFNFSWHAMYLLKYILVF